MRRSSTDESTYRRSPSPEGKEPGFARGGPFRRYSGLCGRAGGGDAGGAGGGGAFFGLHANPGPKAAQARYTSPKGNKYVVFYLDLSFIFLLELKRCGMARACLQAVKYLMFAFNLLFWLGGCGVLGVGIWLAATQGSFATLSSSFPSLSAANLLIVTGTFVMAIGFVGCLGAIKENKCLLLTFFLLLLLVFLLEATIAILFFVYTDKMKSRRLRLHSELEHNTTLFRESLPVFGPGELLQSAAVSPDAPPSTDFILGHILTSWHCRALQAPPAFPAPVPESAPSQRSPGPSLNIGDQGQGARWAWRS
nr:tetraspanin-4 isoform X2 [Saimiri boliviensis boliviensis]